MEVGELVGFHLEAPHETLPDEIERASNLTRVLQFFPSKNNGPVYPDRKRLAVLAHAQNLGMTVVVHASYAVNFCRPSNPDTLKFTRAYCLNFVHLWSELCKTPVPLVLHTGKAGEETTFEEATSSIWPKPGKFTAGEYDYNLEAFAQAIMDECASACTTHKCGTVATAEELIKQHFGKYNEINS